MASKNKNTSLWAEEYGFFGDFYMEGDNSEKGYLVGKKQNLQERTITEVDGIVRILELKGKEKVLDLPCGYGRHSIELAKRGYLVTGSDLNSVHLEKAKKSAEDTKVSIEFNQENMIDIQYDSEFDVLINMFYSFGFFETDNDNLKVLKKFYKSLKNGGKFLMHTDVNIPRILSGKYKTDEIRDLSSGKTLRVIDTYNPDDRKIYGSWIIKDKKGNEIKKDYVMRVYTKEEFIDLCKQVGFMSFEVYGDWDKTPYSENSEDMIIVAKK